MAEIASYAARTTHSADCVLGSQGRVRRPRVVARADQGFCRDVVAERKEVSALPAAPTTRAASSLRTPGAPGISTPARARRASGPALESPRFYWALKRLLDVLARPVRAAQVSSQGKSFNVTFVAANEEITVQCSDNQYILDAAEAAGLDLPATCRGGICGACVTRVVDGTVDMSDIPDLSFTLSENEIAEGCALICMARATSDVRMETQADWGYSLGIAEWKTNGKFTGEVEPLMGKQWKEIKSEA